MKEELHTFRSRSLSNERNIWIRVPDVIETKLKLLLVLDAELYRDTVGAPAIIEELYEQEIIAPALIVYVSCCNRDARWIECPCHPPFATFINKELLPWIMERFPGIKNSQDRIITGLSYTGLAASYVALKSRGLFNKVISQSGSYWSDDCWLASELEEIEEDLNLSFYLDVGSRETDVNVQHKEHVLQVVSQIEGVERFRNGLITKGCEVRYEVFDGGHSCESWAKTLPVALEWALPNQSLEVTQLDDASSAPQL